MCKNNEKKRYNSYNPVIIKRLKEKYPYSTQFIGQSLRGERNSLASLRICEDYKKMEFEINRALNKL